MQESTAANSYEIKRLMEVIVPVVLLGIVSLVSPFALLRNNVTPPYPPPPGWEPSITIYLWGRQFSIAPPSLALSLPFVIITLVYLVIQVVVSMGKIHVKYGVVIEIVLSLIWVTVCELIYGTLQDWTLFQIPLFPIIAIFFLLAAYGIQRRG